MDKLSKKPDLLGIILVIGVALVFVFLFSALNTEAGHCQEGPGVQCVGAHGTEEPVALGNLGLSLNSSHNTLTATLSGESGFRTSLCHVVQGEPTDIFEYYIETQNQLGTVNTAEIVSGPGALVGQTLSVSNTSGSLGSCTPNVSASSGDTKSFNVSDSVNVSSLSNGTYSISVKVTNSFGKSATKSGSFTINRPLPTVNITASKSIVTSGTSVVLTWTTTGNPTNCKAKGSWGGNKNVNGGSQTMNNITSDKNYRIECSNSTGSDTDSVAVDVAEATIFANPAGPIPSGGSTTLTWSSNLPSCSRDWIPNDSVGPNGSSNSGALTQTKTFTINCTNGDATASDNVTVNVTTAPENIVVDLKADGSDGPVSIASGGGVTLSWSITQGSPTTCSASGSWSGSKSVNGGSQNVSNISNTRTYTLTCSDSSGSGSDSVDVRVPTLTVSPSSYSGSSDNPKDHGRFTVSADRDGSGPLSSSDVTSKASWSSSNSSAIPYQGIIGGQADFLCSSPGDSTITASLTDSFDTGGVSLSDTASMSCVAGPPDPPDPDPSGVVCSPSSQTVLIGRNVTFTRSGGSGQTSWSAPGGNPSSGGQLVSFTTEYFTAGSKTVTVTRGSSSDSCSVTVNPPTQPPPGPQFIDIGLRVFDGTSIVRIAAENGTLNSPLRIAKNGTIYAVALVAVNDSNATKLRIRTPQGTKALRRF